MSDGSLQSAYLSVRFRMLQVIASRSRIEEIQQRRPGLRASADDKKSKTLILVFCQTRNYVDPVLHIAINNCIVGSKCQLCSWSRIHTLGSIH